MKGLFKFISEGVYKGDAEVATKPNSAPYLIPVNAKGAFRNSDRQNISVVDVVNDFQWTLTRKQGRKEVPTLELSEYYVNFSTLLNQIRYIFSSLSDTRDAFANLIQTLKLEGPDVNFLSSTASGLESFFINNPTSTIDEFASFSEDVLVQQYLRPYYGLYSTTPTGFRYKLPYYSEVWKENSNAWSDNRGENIGLDSLNNITGSKLFNTIGNVLSPGGTYIERSQQIDYGNDYPSWNISFVLYNTGKFVDVVNNWHFVFMLVYQNLINRTSKVLIEPPVIYEVSVPGVLYTPFGYISTLNIDNIGATREYNIPAQFAEPITNKDTINSSETISIANNNRVNLDSADVKELRSAVRPQIDWMRDIPETNVSDIGVENIVTSNKNIKTVIPEAYRVSMTIKSLVPETRNLMYASINPDRSIYDVNIAVGGTRTDAVNEVAEKVYGTASEISDAVNTLAN